MPPLTDAHKAELAALAERPDSEIDYSDIPPLDESFWARAVPNPLRAAKFSPEKPVKLGVLAGSVIAADIDVDNAEIAVEIDAVDRRQVRSRSARLRR